MALSGRRLEREWELDDDARNGYPSYQETAEERRHYGECLPRRVSVPAVVLELSEEREAA